MKHLASIALLISATFSYPVVANDAYTVYLVRHADIDISDKTNRNPSLTYCGQQRADQLATMLEHIQLSTVYSTDYKRTQATAKPVAQSKTLAITSYDPRALEVLTKEIRSRKSNALVVGHNSTTNAVAGNLAGIELPIVDHEEYDRLYQVTITSSGARLQILNQGFDQS
ncbi:phosphoglycerate mutase family protein [Psychrobium sp. nBUS_13]|uniref:phosphoglycerate mutase family protein n=1 Tax=Psychrobium sp. nBUS_13 TaxID=3395319 RepID=UPI003EC1285D